MEHPYLNETITLLKSLISTPSFSKEEDKTAELIVSFFAKKGILTHRFLNNVWVKNKYYSVDKPTLLLNSHHDTVKPNTSYQRNPFEAALEDDKLYGLGSNDAGGALVCLLFSFLHYFERKDLPYNIIFAATAEEEISGKNGIEALLPHLGKVDFGIVGEPTEMNVALAEKGLLVLDCKAKGKSGHAARSSEGINAIYEALKDIHWFQTYQFPKVSEQLGPIHMNVTMIQAGTQHNVIPDECSYTVDIRATDAYTLEETLQIIRTHVHSEVIPRSVRLRPSGISPTHPLVLAAKGRTHTLFGSPTLSDQALLPFETIKMGPGKSERSHTADEYIYINELVSGLNGYIHHLDNLTSLI